MSIAQNGKCFTGTTMKKNYPAAIFLNWLLVIKTPTVNNSEVCKQSTFVPVAGCVKEDGKQDKKTSVKLDFNQKLDLIKKAEGKSSCELEKTLFGIDLEVSNAREKVREINKDKVEIKVILNKESQEKLEALKKLLVRLFPFLIFQENKA